jgi:hypothetical protein
MSHELDDPAADEARLRALLVDAAVAAYTCRQARRDLDALVLGEYRDGWDVAAGRYPDLVGHLSRCAQDFQKYLSLSRPLRDAAEAGDAGALARELARLEARIAARAARRVRQTPRVAESEHAEQG